MRNDQRGFTLMELMIVVVIIGVLSAIGVPAYKNYVIQAKESACDANRRTIATALGMYYAETGKYPSEEDGFAALSPYVSNIEAIAKCPADKSDYTLSSSGSEEVGWLVTINCKEHGKFTVAGKLSEVELPNQP
ncbi:MAG: type IV pilin protein [Bacillota bacterium]